MEAGSMASDEDDYGEAEGRPTKNVSEEELWQEMDPFVQRFEEAWQKGGRPNIDDFLPTDCRTRLCHAVLGELCKVDLERRRRAGEQVGWEDYQRRYSQ